MATSSDGHAAETVILNDKTSDEEAMNDEKTLPALPSVLPISDIDDGWNPMVDDFKNPEFNHYTSGPSQFKPNSTVQAPWPRKSGKG
jgi:hypothetical protein